MGDTMQYELPSPSHSRKRSSAWVADDENVSRAYAAVNLEDMPSKRLQNPRGEAVSAKQLLKYDAQKLLSHLAFTRYFVTANFQNYSQRDSYIVLCMVSEQNSMYQALCHILPSLYSISPSLQAVGITAGYISPNAMSDQTSWRALPLLTTACVEVSVVEDFERFRRDVGGPQGAIAIIDPSGFCTWNSTESLGGRIETEEDLMALEKALMEVLIGDSEDTAMREG